MRQPIRQLVRKQADQAVAQEAPQAQAQQAIRLRHSRRKALQAGHRLVVGGLVQTVPEAAVAHPRLAQMACLTQRAATAATVNPTQFPAARPHMQAVAAVDTATQRGRHQRRVVRVVRVVAAAGQATRLHQSPEPQILEAVAAVHHSRSPVA